MKITMAGTIPTAQYAWRDVPGHEGAYQVSSSGGVRSLDRVVVDRNGRAMRIKGRVMKLRENPITGYLEVSLGGTPRTTRRVHSLVLEAFVGARPESQEACHNDGDRMNNSVENLRWGTKSENNLDKLKHNTHHYARRNACSRGHFYREGSYRWKVSPKGSLHRWCRICDRMRRAAYRDARGKGSRNAG